MKKSKVGTKGWNPGIPAGQKSKELKSSDGKPKQPGKHHGPAVASHKDGGSAKGLGSNLSFPNTTQAIHISAVKDKMAKNVGGSASHMQVDQKSLGYQDLIESGDHRGVGHRREKY